MALIKPNTTNDSDIYLWNKETGALTHLTPHQGTVSFSPSAFDPASRYLYYLTDDAGEFTRVRRYALAGGAHEDVQKAEWDIVYTYFSHKGTYRVTGINEDGRIAVSIVQAADGKPVSLPKVPDGSVTGVNMSRSEKSMAFYVNSDRSPNNLYVHALGTTAVTRLSNSMNPAIDAADLVDTEVVRFKSFDGMSVPNILWKPHQATAQQKAPALVWVHGGPGGQTTKGYSPVIQYLVTTATWSSASTIAAVPATAKPSSRPTTASTAASRCGIASPPRTT